MQVVHPPPSYWLIGDVKELELVGKMDAENHGESVQEFLLECDPQSSILMVSESHLRLFSCSPRAYRWSIRSLADLDMPPIESSANPIAFPS